ncbi:DUF6919 domain-containing protein [Streptomyces albidoflavus]
MHTPITLPSMSRADQRTWEAARTVAALGELMARWLEGTLESRPGCEARCRPEDEMLPLVPTLAALCRAGYITTGSQPGIVGLGVNGGWEQHAWADLVVTDRALLDRLVAIVTEGGMLVRVHDHRHGAPAASAEQPVVATTCDGQIHMEVGDRMRAIDMPRLWPGLHPALYAARPARPRLLPPSPPRSDSSPRTSATSTGLSRPSPTSPHTPPASTPRNWPRWRRWRRRAGPSSRTCG